MDRANLSYLNDATQCAIAIAALFPEYPAECETILLALGLRLDYFTE